MPITVKHLKVSTIPDSTETDLVRPSDWNADHTLTGLGTMAEQNANAVAITGGTISGVTLPASNITGVLPIANGGTNSTATATAGGIGYGTGTAHAYSVAGIAGQVLLSNGTSAPTWGAAPAAGAGGSNTQIQFNNAGVLAGNATYTMVSGVMKENGFNFVSQADVGSAPNHIPLNQNLGNVAYQDSKALSSTGTLGFVTGAGGAVTQLTSRTTGVTLNKSCGQITMFSAAGSATAATFIVTNNQVASTDIVRVCQQSGTNLYLFLVTAVTNGTFNVTFYTTGGTATDAPVVNFSVIKGSIN